MKKRLAALLLILIPLTPALAWWEYGHETTAQIAEANITAKARANMHRLMRAAPLIGTPACPLSNIREASIWADCIKGDQNRWGYANSWHYQNADICKPFDLKSACAGGNCVSAQVDRNFKLLADKSLPDNVRLEALAFLIHFVGDLHQPLHAGDRSDRGGNDLKANFGIMPGYNLHSVWDGMITERALSAAPKIVRQYSAAEKAEMAGGNSADWSRESYEISRDFAYRTALDGDPCGPVPSAPVTIDEADVQATRAALRKQAERAGLRLARLLDEALK
jgi:S1/P1 Nuclease